MLISTAYAQGAGAPGGGDMLVSLLPLILIFVVFWFLLIRPQQQKLKQHREMIEALKRGDQVLTSGGIVGKIVKVEQDNMLTVEIAQGVQVKVLKATITDIMNKPAQPSSAPANTNKSSQGGVFGRLLGKK